MEYSNIKKMDEELQVVYGEVYVPNVPDAQNEYMSPDTIRIMAYRFLINNLVSSVDTQHNNILNGSYVVESFIAREKDPDFIPESWVVGVHIPDPELWQKVKSGELNGFSIEAAVAKREAKLKLLVPDQVDGVTTLNNGHSHTFIVYLNDDGTFAGGHTDPTDEHIHSILGGSVTEITDGHNHRFSYLEALSDG